MTPDLNLLQALRVLLEERNVTRAAKRLFISQPALSKTLQKLRSEFNDPLFTRTAYGLSPTPRAKQLEQQLPLLLDQLSALLGPPQFEASEYSGQFHLASSDIFYRLLLPQLIPQLHQCSPASSVRAGEVETDFLDQLASGQLDFAIHVSREMPSDFVQTHLGYSQSRCLMRSGHPLESKSNLTLEDYLHYPHVRLYLAQITATDIGVIDEILIQQGKKRMITLESASVHSALEVVANSDALMIAPPEIIRPQLSTVSFRALPAEVDFPRLETVLIQHRRSMASPAHQWLKQLMVGILQPAMQSQPDKLA